MILLKEPSRLLRAGNPIGERVAWRGGCRQTRLTAARAKAEAVVGQEDLSERGKAREIEKLYSRARAGKGAKKAKPSRSQARSNKTKGRPLDGRLRADKRQVSRHLTRLPHISPHPL